MLSSVPGILHRAIGRGRRAGEIKGEKRAFLVVSRMWVAVFDFGSSVVHLGRCGCEREGSGAGSGQNGTPAA
eukprot:3014156-Rhodomonas_salina.3